MSDRLYDYSSFKPERLTEIINAWNGLSGYHGLLVKLCASLRVGDSVLDVGCGACHLHEAFVLGNNVPKRYTGVDNNQQILNMARSRHPTLDIRGGDLYDLTALDNYESVYAVGVYSGAPTKPDGLRQLLNHTKNALILTHFTDQRGVPAPIYDHFDLDIEFIKHNIDPRLEVMRIWI